MKKIIALALAMIMALGMISVAAAEEKVHHIGVLAPAETHGWVGGVLFFAQQHLESLENVKYTLLTSSNAEEMSSQMEQLIDLGVEAIVVWPQFEGVETAAELALEKGIIIANFDMIIDVDEKYADKMYQLTGDNFGMGYEGGRYIAEKLDGKGKVVIMCKPAAANINDDRVAGFKQYIEENAPDIEVIAEIATDFVRATALADAEAMLTAYPEIDAIFSLDDETSIGALQAIKEANRTDIKAITGGGGKQEYFKMMTEDYPDIWVSSATYFPSMIIDTINMALDVLDGKEVEHLVVIPTNIVDRDNVNDFLDDTTPY